MFLLISVFCPQPLELDDRGVRWTHLTTATLFRWCGRDTLGILYPGAKWFLPGNVSKQMQGRIL